jgi:putative resolvase
LLAATGCRVVVLDEMEITDVLGRDVTGVLTSVCARRYGRRPGPHRAAGAVMVVPGGAGDVEPGWVVG